MTPETTIPADLFGDTPLLCRGAPASWRSPLYHPVLIVEIRTFAGERSALVLDGEKPRRAYWADLSLDLSQHLGRAQVCRVLAAGERCQLDHVAGVTCAACHGTGYLRKPAPAWHLLPVSEGGSLPESVSAHSPALIARHARMVAAGGVGIVGVLGEWEPHGPVCGSHQSSWSRVRVTERDRGGGLWVGYAARDGVGWQCGLVPGVDTIWLQGPETGDAGKAKADAAALAAGYALINDGGLVLPEVMP